MLLRIDRRLSPSDAALAVLVFHDDLPDSKGFLLSLSLCGYIAKYASQYPPSSIVNLIRTMSYCGLNHLSVLISFDPSIYSSLPRLSIHQKRQLLYSYFKLQYYPPYIDRLIAEACQPIHNNSSNNNSSSSGSSSSYSSYSSNNINNNTNNASTNTNTNTNTSSSTSSIDSLRSDVMLAWSLAAGGKLSISIVKGAIGEIERQIDRIGGGGRGSSSSSNSNNNINSNNNNNNTSSNKAYRIDNASARIMNVSLYQVIYYIFYTIDVITVAVVVNVVVTSNISFLIIICNHIYLSIYSSPSRPAIYLSVTTGPSLPLR